MFSDVRYSQLSGSGGQDLRGVPQAAGTSGEEHPLLRHPLLQPGQKGKR